MAMTPQEIISKLGPLSKLAGKWEGAKGDDMSPDDDRTSTENNKYLERLTLEPFGPVNNHEQEMYGLRYSMMAWRLGVEDAFHEEVGYYLWDPKAKQVMKCFIVPRGISVIAGGTVEPNAKEFKIAAKLGSPTYGIASNQFLDVEFKTTYYEIKFKIEDDQTFTYEQDTHIVMKNRKDIFHHTDKNTLKKVK